MSAPGRSDFIADCAAGEGHFPGNPIVPGASLLDQILRRLPLAASPVCVHAVKFRNVVTPGTPVQLEYGDDGAGRCRFVLRAGGRICVDGVAS